MKKLIFILFLAHSIMEFRRNIGVYREMPIQQHPIFWVLPIAGILFLKQTVRSVCYL